MGPPPGKFPITPPSDINDPGAFAIYWGMDDRLKTPSAQVMTFSLTRDLGHNMSLEVSYVGRLGRHLLQETDLAMPEGHVIEIRHGLLHRSDHFFQNGTGRGGRS